MPDDKNDPREADGDQVNPPTPPEAGAQTKPMRASGSAPISTRS